MSLFHTDTRTAKEKAWAMIQPRQQDDLTEIIEQGVARKAEIERLAMENDCGALFVGYLATKYRVDKPFISKKTGMKLGKAMKALPIGAMSTISITSRPIPTSSRRCSMRKLRQEQPAQRSRRSLMPSATRIQEFGCRTPRRIP
jgi:hypothetical protein